MMKQKRCEKNSLYNQVKSDLLHGTTTNHYNNNDPIMPSITTIVLLQLQAYIVKLLVQSESPNNAISQFIHWLLLFALLILDNIARLLNIEQEISNLHSYKKKKSQKDQDQQTFLSSDAVTITNSCHTSPQKSPTPTYIRQKKTSHLPCPTSPSLESTGIHPTTHGRSLSNTLMDKKNHHQQQQPQQQHMLRRMTAQREMSTQSTISSPTSSQKNYKSHRSGSSRRTLTPISSTANSVTSRSSSSESSFTKESILPEYNTRPRVVQSRSLTTHNDREQDNPTIRKGRTNVAAERVSVQGQ